MWEGLDMSLAMFSYFLDLIPVMLVVLSCFVRRGTGAKCPR
jgi:hypothetical protein